MASGVALSALLLISQTIPFYGNPTGGVVAAGNASITSAGSTVKISQSTNTAIINWQGFSINAGELTKFLVPSSSAATLNRVLGGNPSAIYGTLQSNGIVFLINPSGIVVGPNGRIDTAGFLGSTLDISDDEFLVGGNLHLTGPGQGSIDNEGVIHASSGDVYLIANQVTNSGTIKAPRGNVGLAAGGDVLFQQAGDQHLFVQASNPSAPRALGVSNAGTVLAATAELKAAGGNAYALAINNTGQISANGYKKINGQVYLTADGGDIANAGAISANNPGGSGGTIVLNGYGTASAGTVLDSGRLLAVGKKAGATGGTVEVLGNRVGLLDDGVVDVSGDAGGGTALIGGDEHGANPAIPDADQTYLGPDASIQANAFTLGNGGKVIVWGDDTTQAYGAIGAQGGAQGGNGGFVETSAHDLDVQTTPNLAAPHGSAGAWLLDPYDLTISANATSGITTTAPFTDSGSPANLDVSDLQAALQGSGAGVVIDTSTANSGGTGNITWQSGATLSTSGIAGGTLTLTGPGEILLDGASITGAGSLNLVLNSTTAATSSSTFGNVVIENSTLDLGGGNLSIAGSGRIDSTDNSYVDAVNIFDNSTLNAGGGNIFISGKVFNTAPSVTGGYFGVFVEDSTVETSGSGTLSLTGTVGQSGAAVASDTQVEGVGLNFFTADTGTNILQTANGALAITGKASATVTTGSSTSGYSVEGVDVSNNTQINTTGTGSLTITGDTSNSTTPNQNLGVAIEYGSSVGTTGSSTGITITGTGGTISGTPGTPYGNTPSSTAGSQTEGIEMQNNGSITASGATPITLSGVGGTDLNVNPAGYCESIGISIDTPVSNGTNLVSSAGGTIQITGEGGLSSNQSEGFTIGNGDNSSASGLSEITSTTGNIAITGYVMAGTPAAGSFSRLDGVGIENLSKIETGTGAITINGNVDEPTSNGTVLNAIGVSISDTTIEATQAGGSIFIVGDDSGTSDGGVGVTSNDIAAGLILGFNSGSTADTSTISVAGGTGGLNLTGYGGTLANPGTNSAHQPLADGLLLGEGATLTALGSAPITLTGVGGDDELTNTTLNSEAYGIIVNSDIDGATTTITSAAGAVLLRGYAGSSLTSTAGVEIFSGSGGANSIGSTQSTVTLDGTLTAAAATTAQQLGGVDLTGDDTIQTNNGLIDITGTIDTGSGLSGCSVSGVSLEGDITIQALGAAGAITIAGDAAGSTSAATTANTGGGDIGTNIQGYNVQSGTDGQVTIAVGSSGTPSTSTSGISITGTGGAITTDASTSNGPTVDGIDLTEGVAIIATGSAPISLHGTGGINDNTDTSNTGEANGIDFTTDNNGSIAVTSGTGTITLTGTGGMSANGAVGVLIAATNTTSVSANQVTASIESTGGAIDITGVGGSGYIGSGTIVGQYVPDAGVIVADFSNIFAGGAIALTGTGSSYSPGVSVLQLPTGSFGTVHGVPLLLATGAFSATALSGTGIYLNGTINGDGIALGTESSSSPFAASSGSLQIVDSLIVLTGGNMTAYGQASLTDTAPDGIEIEDSTLNGAGGSITLDGRAGGFVYENTSVATALNGLEIAGAGTLIDNSTVETTGSGGITALGYSALGTTVQNGLVGLEVESSSVTVVDGVISLTGTVASGTSVENPLATNMFSGSVDGVNIGEDSSTQETGEIAATGTGTGGGSIVITGNTSGATSQIQSTSEEGESRGVHIESDYMPVFVDGGTAGIVITGTGGAVTNDQTTANNTSAYGSDGIDIYNGGSLTAAGSAPITLVGTGGSITCTSGQTVGSSIGTIIEGNEEDPEPAVQVTSASGPIGITGTGGASANAGIGVVVLGQNGGTASITSTSGNITLTGVGGTGNSGAAATAGVSADNDGVAVLDGATVQSASGNLVFDGTAGTGDAAAYGVGAKSFVSGDITTGSLPVVEAGSGTLTLAASTGGVIYDAAPASASATQASAATFTSPKSVAIDSPIAKMGGLLLVEAPLITLDSTIAANDGEVALVDTTQFVNAYGSGALTSANGYTWQVWSVNPAGSGQGTVDQDNGLTPAFIQYDATYSTTTLDGTGNALLYTYNPAPLSVTLTGTFTKTYDGTLDLTIPSASYAYSSTGLVTGDTLTPTSGALTLVLNSKDVATATGGTVATSQLGYAATRSGVPVYGYTIAAADAAASVTRATATASLTGTVTKTYDATTTATLSPSNYTLGGIVGGDSVALNDPTAGTYDTPNVGTGKTVTVTGLSLSGANMDDYVLASTTISGAVGVINAAGVTVSLTPSLTGTITKVYDGTDLANNLTSANYELTGVMNGDNVTLTGPATGTYASPNVGTGILVTSGTGLQLTGAQAANYTLNSTTASGDIGIITPAPVTAVLTGTISKVYNDTLAATLGSGNYSLTGVLGSDNVTITGPTTGTYASKDVGTGILVTSGTGLTLGGAQVGDYQLSNTTAGGDIGAITRATLTASLTGTVSKTYDSTNIATLSNSNYSLTGVLGSDNVTITGPTSGTYASKDVGTGILVTSGTGLTLGGAQVGDYQLGNTTAGGDVGAITPATLTPSLTGAVDKVYDGTTTATIQPSNLVLTGLKGSDSPGFTDTAAYSTKNVGQGETVTVNSLALTGPLQSDYQLTSTSLSANIGNISAAPLSITANNVSILPGASLPSFTASYSGFGTGDSPSVLTGTLAFQTSATSSSPDGSYPVTPSGLSDPNYQIVFDPGTLTIGEPATVTPTIPIQILSVINPPVTTITDPTTTDLPGTPGTPGTPAPGTPDGQGGQSGDGAPAQPPPVSYVGNGGVRQSDAETGGLADSSSSGSQVGSNDAVQVGSGQVNNVASPAASGALDAALSPAIHNTLTDAMNAFPSFGDDETTPPGTSTASNDRKKPQEKILDAGGVVEIDSTGVKSIPLSAAPASLRNALADNSPPGASPAAGH